MYFSPAFSLLIACFLSISSFAQIEKTTRGVPCSYDTCVTIALDNYRQIRQQFINRDSLITSLKQQIVLMGTQEMLYDSIKNNFRQQITSFNNTISRKDSVILNLEGSVDELAKTKTTDPKRWYQRPSTWISGLVGIFAGFLIAK